MPVCSPSRYVQTLSWKWNYTNETIQHSTIWQSIYETVLDEFYIALTVPAMWLLVSSGQLMRVKMIADRLAKRYEKLRQAHSSPRTNVQQLYSNRRTKSSLLDLWSSVELNYPNEHQSNPKRTKERTSDRTNEAKRNKMNWNEVNRCEVRFEWSNWNETKWIKTKGERKSRRNEAKWMERNETNLNRFSRNWECVIDNKRRILSGRFASAG